VGGELLSYAQAHEVVLQALTEGDGERAGRLLRELLTRLLAAIADMAAD